MRDKQRPLVPFFCFIPMGGSQFKALLYVCLQTLKSKGDSGRFRAIQGDSGRFRPIQGDSGPAGGNHHRCLVPGTPCNALVLL